MIRRFWHDDKGATAIEYGLVLSLVAIAVVTGVGEALEESEKMFADLAKTFDNVQTP